VGIRKDRVQVATTVGCPAPSWNDSNAEASDQGLWWSGDSLGFETHECVKGGGLYYSQKNGETGD